MKILPSAWGFKTEMHWNQLEEQYQLYGDHPAKRVARTDKNLQAKLCKYQRRMRHTPTNAEKRFKQILYEYFGFKHNRNYYRNKPARKFIQQQKIFVFNTQDGKGKGYIVDFYLPKFNLVFEIDGDSHKNTADYDHERARLMLVRRGVKTVRITNAETKNTDSCKTIIDAAIKGLVRKEHQTRRPTRSKLSRDDEITLQTDWLKHNQVTICPAS